jgi:hypothetical protein
MTEQRVPSWHAPDQPGTFGELALDHVDPGRPYAVSTASSGFADQAVLSISGRG